MNVISCICLTYGRIPQLQEAIESFRRQQCSWNTELVILNTLPDQKLELDPSDFPNVHIFNLEKRPPNLGAARNLAISMANGTHIVTWDDDDLYLPGYLQQFVRVFERETDLHWVWQNRQFYMEKRQLKKLTDGTFNTVAFTKSAWESLGGYGQLNVGEDRDFVMRLTAKHSGTKAEIVHSETGFIYCWGNGVYHLSGMGGDSRTKVASWERSRVDVQSKLKRGVIPSGTIRLQPGWSADYAQTAKEFLIQERLAGEPINGLGVVLLGRYGDIINALPILKRLHEAGENPHLVVASEFADMLEGVSYVTPFPIKLRIDQLSEAMAIAKSRFKSVLRLQIYGKDHNQQRLTKAYNLETWREAGMESDFHNAEMPPVFDRRNAARESALVKKLFITEKPKLITNLTGGVTSQCSRGPAILAAIKETFGKTHEVVEIGRMKLHRIFDLLAIIERARLLISVDTSTLHLAAATGTPVIALVNKNPWLGSAVRFNAVARVSYSEATSRHVISIAQGVLQTVKKLGHHGKHDVITVRRTGAIGDVVAATSVADALFESGHEVEFQADPSIHPILRLHSKLSRISVPSGTPDVNLDGAYEAHLERRTLSMGDIYRNVANSQLTQYGIRLPAHNWSPMLRRSKAFPSALKGYERPFVMIAPRSNMWVNRTVPDAIWMEAAKLINGTKCWLGSHGPAPDGIVDLQCRSIASLADYIAAADFVVTVDSGPMHIAAAMRVPMVVIEQATGTHLRLNNQRDWKSVGASLDCLNCQLHQCNINAGHPPCQNVSPSLIAKTVQDRMLSLPGTSGTVSATIAVYKPQIEKLNRCLKAVLSQVDEVVICGDLDTPWPIHGLLSDAKIHCVRLNGHTTGYGKKATCAARHSNGEFLHQLNDDVYLNDGVIAHLKSLMTPDVAVVTHTLRYLDGRIQYAGKFRERGSRGFGHIDHLAKSSRYKTPLEQESACGASMLVRRAAFFEAGGFDERYYLYSDDDSLVMDIRSNGWKVIFTPHVEGLHEEHASTSITPRWRDVLDESNRKFAEKWKFYFDKNPNPNVIGKF